jgi:transcriptional regulator with XRE-family HTH domain
MLTVMATLEERFWACVDRRGYDECWPWRLRGNKDGYGQFDVQAGELDVPEDFMTPGGLHYRQLMSHRIAFYLAHARWPAPLGLHGCDNPACCNAENPVHVHEGTHSQNSQEMFGRDRQPVRMRGGETNYNAVLTTAEVEQIRARWMTGGVTQRELAAEFGVQQPAISRYVRGHRFASAEVSPQPVRARKFAVVPADVRAAVLAARAEGLSQGRIAVRLGIGQTTVSRILRRIG